MATGKRTQKLHPEGLLGKKLGMTQIYTEDGNAVPVTVIQVGPCFIVDLKNEEKHGYKAVQLGFEPKKQQRVRKPLMGHFARSGKGAFYHVQELRCDTDALGWNTLGQELKVSDVFTDGDWVDVSGVSIGRGFSGVVRRFKVKGQPATRGTHEYRRHIGAIGCRKFPGRVFKNQRMPGRMGGNNVTVQNLKVMGVRPDENVILVRGGIPGATGGLIVIKKAIKHYSSSKAA
ncbi:MAG: 50S ribosomal protein L3 [Deltaproteobacteria bacterium]|nr:50S ribosomal protein L3 [Deltaproteobacteria bacterium]